MNTSELVLIDLSSIAYPIYMKSASEPDPNTASTRIVARVRALAGDHAHVAICCDAGRSFRAEISPIYKANRPVRDEVLHHQIDLSCERLKGDGFPVWSVKGFEADDLIATAVAKARSLPEPLDVLIVSADKDILQLVGPHVRAKSVKDGTVLDSEAVKAKFGVSPEQIQDYLCLVGDVSDNIKGAKGIGEKKAAELLGRFGSIDRIYEELHALGSVAAKITPGLAEALAEFEPRLELTRRLIALRTDADISFDDIAAERVPQEEAAPMGWDYDEQPPRETPAPQEPIAPEVHAGPVAVPDAEPQAIAVREPEVMAPAPSEWERQLDPRSLKDARNLALDMFQSRMFSAYGTPQGVLSTVMVGRELGLPAMASLRSIYVVEGRHTLSSALMVALVLKSGLAEYFRPVDITDKAVTFETLRKGPNHQPFKLTHTIEMAVVAGLVKPNSNWTKVPVDMLVARCQARLARLVYPDLLVGMYSPEELEELRDAVA